MPEKTPDYMEFPVITATTTEGKVQQLIDYNIKLQEKINQLIAIIYSKGE